MCNSYRLDANISFRGGIQPLSCYRLKYLPRHINQGNKCILHSVYMLHSVKYPVASMMYVFLSLPNANDFPLFLFPAVDGNDIHDLHKNTWYPLTGTRQ